MRFLWSNGLHTKFKPLKLWWPNHIEFTYQGMSLLLFFGIKWWWLNHTTFTYQGMPLLLFFGITLGLLNSTYPIFCKNIMSIFSLK